MLKAYCFIFLVIVLNPLPAREFSVMAYNVNNFFDIDGLAKFGDFKQTGNKSYAYSARKLLTKIENMASILKTINQGKGPDIILFQEFEYDHSPKSSIISYRAFLKEYAETSVEDMLTSQLNKTIAGLPVEAFVLKYLDDSGMGVYQVAISADRRDIENSPPHSNVVFSRYPIVETRSHPVWEAREIVEVLINIEGHTFTIFNNHWKSNIGGMERTEKYRKQNAATLRKRIDQILSANPSADIIVGGDLNSQYNQTQVHQTISESGINDILKSGGDEAKMLGAAAGQLYNLWYEVPAKERFSDCYNDYFGTLMHIILSQGLYDYSGIQYVDNSFSVVRIPGVNAERNWLVPVRPWIAGKTGGGYSDHFPLLARFRTVDDGDNTRYLNLEKPGKEALEDAQPISIGYDTLTKENTLDARILVPMDRGSLSKYYDRLFHVAAKYEQGTGVIVIGSNKFKLYSHKRKVKSLIKALPGNEALNFFGKLSEYKGKLEFIIDHPSWLEKGEG